jgi:hypothetical protein
VQFTILPFAASAPSLFDGARDDRPAPLIHLDLLVDHHVLHGHGLLATSAESVENEHAVLVDVHQPRRGTSWLKIKNPHHSDSSDFEITSELLVVQGELVDGDGRAGKRYFRWHNHKFSLIHFEEGCPR